MNIWGILFIISGIIVLIGIFQQGGWKGFSSSPVQSSWEATKTIGKTSSEVYQWGKEKIGKDSSSLKNLGLPLCETNLDCNMAECKIENCLCGDDGNCYLNQTR